MTEIRRLKFISLVFGSFAFVLGVFLTTQANAQKKELEIIEVESEQQIIDMMKSLFATYGELVAKGEYKKAIEPTEKLVRYVEAYFGKSSKQYVDCRQNLARVYRQTGRVVEALFIQVDAHNLARKLYGADHEQYAMSALYIGDTMRHLENLHGAEHYYQKAMRVFEKAGSAGSLSYGATLNNLGVIYLSLGQPTNALTYLSKAKEIVAKQSGRDSANYARSLISIAGVLKDTGKGQQAFDTALEAYRIIDALDRQDLSAKAECLGFLGDHYLEEGDVETAEKCYQDMVAIYKHAGGETTLTYARGLSMMATVAARNNRFQEALELSLKNRQIIEDTIGTGNQRYAAVSKEIGNAYAGLGKLSEAASSFEQSLKIGKAYSLQEMSVRSDRDQLAYLNQFLRPVFERAIRFTVEKEVKPELGANWLANYKSIATQTLAIRNTLTKDPDPAVRKLAKQLAAVRQKSSSLANRKVEENEAAKNAELRDELRVKENELIRELGAFMIGRKGDGFDRWIESDDVRSALKNGEVFVDYSRIGLDEDSASYVAWISHSSDSKKPTTLVKLGNANEIDSLIRKTREAIQGSVNDFQVEGEVALTKKVKLDLAELYRQIWKPVESALGKARNVVISPDGELWHAPWASLTPDQNKAEYLIERYPLRFVASANSLVAKRATSQQTFAPTLFANPLYDQTVTEKRKAIRKLFPGDALSSAEIQQVSSGNLPLVKPLPLTEAVAKTIAQKIRRFSNQTPVIHTDDSALEKLAKSLMSPKVLTFGTHGFFLSTQSADVGDFSDQQTLRSISVDRNSHQIENPLLRCGLLLAGCNKRDSIIGDDDGVLTGLEIVGIDLRGTELVVLSACETGLGDVRNGEGVAGLRQAFQLAGAESVLATLWQVEDKETAKIVNSFFDNLANGMTKSEALRQAQLSRIKARRARHGAAHPFFWAAFTLTGQD